MGAPKRTRQRPNVPGRNMAAAADDRGTLGCERRKRVSEGPRLPSGCPGIGHRPVWPGNAREHRDRHASRKEQRQQLWQRSRVCAATDAQGTGTRSHKLGRCLREGLSAGKSALPIDAQLHERQRVAIAMDHPQHFTRRRCLFDCRYAVCQQQPT